MDKKINIVHVGVSGFPITKSAAINRCFSVYSILLNEKINVHIINKRAVNNYDNSEKIKRNGYFSKISYKFTSPSPYKPSKFISRRYFNFIGVINEFILLFKLGLQSKINLMFFYPKGNFFELLYYRMFSKMFRIPLVSHYVEYRSSFKNRNKIWLKINDFLFDNYFMFFVDGIIPISEYLVRHVKNKTDLPMIKIPPVVDFNLFSEELEKKVKKNFLYVGSANYIKAIKTILKAFERINNNDYFLYMILHGQGTNKIINQIQRHPKKDLIRIYSGLGYMELIRFYKQANALIVPLTNNIQDSARFPNKIAEYLASANPIITTNVGEIKAYFIDEYNALVADEDNPESISEKMKFIIDFPDKAKTIGRNGYKTGLRYFDSNSYRKELTEFVFSQINS